LLLIAALAAPLGCDDDPPATAADAATARYRIRADVDSAAIRPGQSRTLAFFVVDEQDRSAPGRPVRFTIVDDTATPADDARGATLAADQALTDAEGRATVQVVAGLETTFRLRASSAGAEPVEIFLLVDSGTHVAMEILPRVVPATLAPPVTTVRIYLYSRQTCAAHTPIPAQPREEWPVRSLPLDTSAIFTTIPAQESHAVVGVGLDADEVARVGGCVDLPPSTLLVQEAVRVILPLRPLLPGVAGAFRVSTRLRLRQAVAAQSTYHAEWGALAACPTDPARLWLDCVTDALGVETAEDPLDCRPRADEGRLGAKLAARRGVPAPAPSPCRGRLDGAGRPALDGLVADLFAHGPMPLRELPVIVGEADRLFDELHLESRLRLAATPLPDTFTLTHTLRALEFGSTSVSLATLGAPAPEATFVRATQSPGLLTIGPHGFTLRLGTAARAAFSQASLAKRGLATPVSAFVSRLFGEARSPSRAAGCDAFDETVCPAIGEDDGCVREACTAAVLQIAERLDAAFSALDGRGVDLTLQEGTAPTLDRDRDRVAEALGGLDPAAGGPGLWSGTLHPGAAPPSPLQAVWVAERTP
jgi:hypothetical protein